MRLLHVGAGFRPWRRGGLVAYVEDLVAAQARAGHAVSYVFAGRQYPVRRRTRLRRWERAGVTMLEVVDSPLYDHGRQPDLELDEPRTEALLRGVLDEVRPDVVHVHELAGLPSSVLELPRERGIPVLFTLQDYFALCPVFKLVDARGRSCLGEHTGADCARAAQLEVRPPGLLVDGTVRNALTQLPGAERMPRTIHRVSLAAGRRMERDEPRESDAGRTAAYARRRAVNTERLGRVDMLIAMSHRVEELYRHLGVDGDRLRTVHLTLSHIERLRPRVASPGSPVTFVTLGGLESSAKGAEVLLDAVRIAGAAAGPGALRVLALGHAEERFAREAARVPEIELRGPYTADRLGAVLDEGDVGLLTSIWEEAYAYAGVEMLAKGLPVVANAIGGMTDYTRPGETGWLNRSCTARELADIMLDIVAHPEQIVELNARLRAQRDTIVKPMAEHLREMDALYAELVAAGAAA